ASNAVTFGVGTGTVNGTVTQSGPGTPINGSLVELLQSNVVKAAGNTAADGTYSISSLAAGSYDVRFSKTGLGTVLSVGSVVNAASTTTVNAALPSPGAISGTVTKASGGTAVLGASLAIMSGAVTAATAVTDAAGAYTAPNLSAGTYTVAVSVA